MQPSARKSPKRASQIDGKLHDIIPRTEQEDVVAARINDVDVALPLLLPAEERKLLLAALTHAVDLAAAQRVDIMLEKQRKLARQDRRARQCRILFGKAREKCRAEIVHIGTQHAQTTDSRTLLRPAACICKLGELHDPALSACRIVAEPQVRRQALARIDLVLDIEAFCGIRQILNARQGLRRKIHLASQAWQGQGLSVLFQRNAEDVLRQDAFAKKIEIRAHRAGVRPFLATVSNKLR